MSFLPEPYGKWAAKLEENLLKLIEKRDPTLPEDKRKKLATALAAACILSAEYGAGDALAGYMLSRIGNDSATAHRIVEVLGKLGVKNLPKPRLTVAFTCLSIMREADFGDEELNKMMRELYRFALTGGRYTP